MIHILLLPLLSRGLLEALCRLGRLDPEWDPQLEYTTEIPLLATALTLFLSVHQKGCLFTEICTVFLGTCLLLAGIMDIRHCFVYTYVWLPALLAALCLLTGSLSAQDDPFGTLLSLVIYCLLQEMLFAQMYGRADCHAFSICAIYTASLGLPMIFHLLHMTFTFLLLAFHQGCRRNITLTGRLHHPVPLIPYIILAFYGMHIVYLCIHSCFSSQNVI